MKTKICKHRGAEFGIRYRVTEDVKTIRQLKRNGMTQQIIADRFGVCQVNVSNIVRRRIWKDI